MSRSPGLIFWTVVHRLSLNPDTSAPASTNSSHVVPVKRSSQ